MGATGTGAAPTAPGQGRSGGSVLVRVRFTLVVGMVAANVIGALVVFVLAAFIVPEPPLADHRSVVVANLVAALGYLAVAIVVGVVVGFRRLGSLYAWLPAGDVPSADQQTAVLRGPQRLAAAIGVLWAVAVIAFGVFDLRHSAALAIRVVLVVGFGGLATCTVAYLLAERLLREAAARALAASDRPQRIVQSVATRQVLTWVLTTGGPVLGLVVIGIANLAGAPDMDRHLGRTMVALGGTGLAVGLLATIIAARASADPIVSVRNGVDRISDGDLSTEVPVYDGTEIGLLQAGFNRMAAGLREREELQDLFGRHVGVEVARQAMENGIELGGEVRAVAVLFVDLVGSTALATKLAPAEVVETLNRFFAIVVSVVEDHGGFINKFAGDAVLAIFGAPAPVTDRCACALAAARRMADRLRRELGDTDFGVGVAAGEAVAGNIGTARRLEYTVIGDPVNEAARLTDLAKGRPQRVAASGDVVVGAGDEGRHWVQVDETVLRGREQATLVFVPAEAED